MGRRIIEKPNYVARIRRQAIERGKACRTPEQKDIVAMWMLRQYYLLLAKDMLSNPMQIKKMDSEWQWYLEHTGKHAVHDHESFQINLIALLMQGLTMEEIAVQRIGWKICNETLGWGDPDPVIDMLLEPGEKDVRVFMVEKQE